MAELTEHPGWSGSRGWRRIQRGLASRVLFDPWPRSERTVLLAGSGRSGTTWLAELLNHDNAFRYLFEPLHPGDRERLPPRTYARPGSADPAVAGPVDAVVTGRVRDRWTDQYNRRVVAVRRLVKEVWQNPLLGWLHRRHPGVRIVLVLRHPCAVAHSQLETGWDWRTDPGSFLGQTDLMAAHLEPHRDLLEQTADPFDRHVLTWCVENAVPLRELPPGLVHVAFYEQLRADPERELPPLFAFAGRSWNPGVLERTERPSALARREGPVTAGRDVLRDWMTTVPAERLARTKDLLEAFGLDRLYAAREPMPLIGREDVLPSAGLSTG